MGRYWVAGNCLAGETCIFSHDPAHLMNKLTVEGGSSPPQHSPANIQIQDFSSFPTLGSLGSMRSGTPDSLSVFGGGNSYPVLGISPPPGFKSIPGSDQGRPRSRPQSRHQQSKESAQAAPSLDDTEAFPTLGSASAKAGKKHHGKRGHGHTTKESFAPSSLADIVKMSPSPGPASNRLESKKMVRNGSSTSIRNGENSTAAQSIQYPQHIPWLETGDKANKAYLKARAEAIKHGGMRNKFLQRYVFHVREHFRNQTNCFGCSAAQAWNRNDARAAKALSLRGQSENELMRKAHREAAQELYAQRNKSGSNCPEMYVDLHGLHPEEAVEYLERVLLENEKESRIIYAITGTGHHSKNGKDKVGKALRNFLNEWRYSFREFSPPQDRNNQGGILGIDAQSWDKSLVRDNNKKKEDGAKEEVDILSQGVEIGEGKVKLLVRDTTMIGREPPKGPRGR